MIYLRLTTRQLQVLGEILWDGADNPTIARRLGVTLNTVKTHVKDILRKSGARNRTELVVNIFRGYTVVHDPEKIIRER